MVGTTTGSKREFDLVVFGATGFTGRLVAEYLSKNAPKTLRWAIAGRSEGSLKKVLSGQCSEWKGNSEVQLVIANSADFDSLVAMAKRTSTIISTVGPFTLYGTPLVKACVQEGTCYVDTTGELNWVNPIEKEYNAAAEKSGAVISSLCAFEAIPADLGVLTCVNELRRRGTGCKWAKAGIRLNGAPSGGTIYSGISAIKEAVKSGDMGMVNDSHWGYPEGVKRPENNVLDKPRRWPVYDKDLGGYTLTGPLNTFIALQVRKSAGYARQGGAEYGKDFHYNDFSLSGSYLQQVIVALVVTLIPVVAIVPGLYALLKAIGLLPKPGQGPSEETRKKSFFKYTIVAEGENGDRVTVEMRGGDAGYSETSKMVAESGLCLALQRSELPNGYDKKGGVVPPSRSMGLVLAERLRRAGLALELK